MLVELGFFAVFSILAALIFNFINPKIMALQWAQDKGTASYAGRTLVTAASFFIVLAAAGVLMSLVTGKAERLPAAP